MDEIKDSERQSITFNAFERLESVDRDPFDDLIRQLAKKLEADINSDIIAPDAGRERLVELNSLWPYAEQELPVSGFAFLPRQNLPTGESGYDVEEVVDEKLLSKGMSVIALATELEGETLLRYEVCLLFVRNGSMICMPLNDTTYEAPLRHPEVAEKNLLYFHNDQTLEVHRSIEAWQGEMHPIFSLADYSTKVMKGDVERVQYIEDMGLYLTGHFHFDTQVPYLIALSEEGSLYVVDKVANPGGDTYTQVDRRRLSGLCRPGRIKLLPEDVDTVADEQLYIPHLEVILYGPELGSEEYAMYTPIKEIETFVSIRSQVYGDN